MRDDGGTDFKIDLKVTVSIRFNFKQGMGFFDMIKNFLAKRQSYL